MKKAEKYFFQNLLHGTTAYDHSRPSHGNLFRVLIWPAGAAFLAAIVWYLLLTNLAHYKQLLEESAVQEAQEHAKTYSAHLGRTIEALDQIARHVRLQWKLSDAALRLEEVTELGLFPSSADFYANIADSNGTIVTTTIPEYAGANVADRGYFRAQEFGAVGGLYIGEPVLSRAMNNSIIAFSHRIEEESGEFAGVVALAVRPNYLVATYDETIFGHYGFLAMIGTDSVIRASRYGNLVASSNAPVMTTVPTFETPSGYAILNGDEWFRDGRTRYVGWQSIPHYPFVAVVGIDQQEALGPYWERRKEAIEAGILVTAGLTVFSLIAMVFSLRLARRELQLQSAQRAYRLATESGQEGFYILRPILTSSGTVKDFQIIDCNQHAAVLFRHRKEELLGKTIAALYDSAHPDRLSMFLRRAMETGSSEEEWEITGTSAFNSKWISIKAVHADGNLALNVRDISEAKEHVAKLERQSNEDLLTGLPNRQWVQEHLPKAIEHAVAEGTMLAVLFIDLDGFKAVNDTQGHEAGDEVLRMASHRLKDAVRPHDYVVRLGGDEFVIVLDTVEHQSDAAHVAERIQQAFKDGFRLPQGVQLIGASVGISLFPNDGTDAETLLRHADIAMYAVKTAGKRDYRFYDAEFYEKLRVRREKEEELRYAIKHDQFLMYYQPRIDMNSGKKTSMEALVRWAHPTKGLIGPVEFITIAEETNLILPLGELVIEKVCSQLAWWASRGKTLVPVSINVSCLQFNQANFSAILSSAMSRHKIAPEWIEIEITESSMMGDEDDIRETIASLQKIGIKMLVDDFGTGYSSLSQLQQMEFDVMKVDRAFTAQLAKAERGTIFFKAIITMAHALGMRVVAEGVESSEQLRVLKTLNCDEVQGYYISEPLPAEDALRSLPGFPFSFVT